MEFTIRVDLGTIVAIYGALVLFGIAFNSLTEYLESLGYAEGFTSLLVALGAIITISPLLWVSPLLTLFIAGLFVSSGTPMILGSITRYMRARGRAAKAIAELHNEHPKRLAK